MSKGTTPKFRVSYPNVFKPRRNELNGKDEYSVVALFKKGEDLSKLKKLVQEAAEKEFGKDPKKWPKNMRSPFRDQAERSKVNEETGQEYLPDGYEAGAIFINLKSAHKPGVVDGQVQPILDEAEFYPGCYAIASVNAYAYNQKGNAGVSLGLQNIQKVAEGEPFGGRSKAEDDFAAVPAEDASSLF